MHTDFWNSYLLPFVYLLEEMAPYLLLGFLIAGVLHAFVPRAMYRRYLAANSVRSVLCAIALGVPLPLCSCGVIPTAVGMRREGASKGATTAFLIATPQTGVDSILATYAVFGLPFALLRPIVAMVTGFLGGVATHLVAPDEAPETDDETVANANATKAETSSAAADPSAEAAETTPAAALSPSLWQRCISAFRYGFVDMLMDIGHWLVLGLLLAGLITIFVPEDFFLAYSHNSLVGMLIVLLIACPMYVCATGSIPIAAALMLKGLSPGAALVFLMAGPATNMASIMVLGKTLGRRSLAVYMASIIFGAIAFGLLVDATLPAEWFTQTIRHAYHSSCCHTEAAPLWKVISAVVLAVFLVHALWKRFAHKAQPCACSGEGCTCSGEGCTSSDGSCTCSEEGCTCSEEGCTCSNENTNANAEGAEGAAPAAPAPSSRTVHLRVTGMMCNHCRAHVLEALEGVEGTESVEVDLAEGSARVVCSAATPSDALIAAVEKCGYTCSLAE